MDPVYEISWTRQRLIKAWNFMKLLRVEPYLFLIMFQTSLKGIPRGQLLQDKICMQWYQTSDDYCKNLPTIRETDSNHGHYKSRILTDVALFGTYSTYLSTVPAIIWAMFVGSWIDRYVKARKILMVFSVGSAIIENLITIFLSIKFDTSPYYNLLLHIPTSLFGGDVGSSIAITHFMASTTPPKLMAIRFLIFEMCKFVASPIGSSLGGYILVQKPIFNTGEIRNYTLCFIIALAFEVLALLWIVFMINESFARKQEMKIETKIRGIQTKVGKESAKIKLRSDMSQEDKKVHPIKLLFDLENVKSMVKTMIKNRPNKVRIQLFLIFSSITVMVVAHGNHFSGQFIQRVYLWAPDRISYIRSIALVIHSITTITIVPFLIKVVKVNDIPLAIIGYCSAFTVNIIRSTWLSPYAYYISLPIESIGGISSLGVRSHLTKIVGKDEIGKVLSFTSALDTFVPMIATTIFAYIFKYTVDTYPGTVFQVSALLVLIQIYLMMWIDLFTERPFVGEAAHHKRNGHHNKNNNNQKKYTDNENQLNSRTHRRLHRYHHKYHINKNRLQMKNIDKQLTINSDNCENSVQINKYESNITTYL